jgi:hypothetical protein
MPARKEHKVYTIPTAGTPSVMSPEARKSLDAFLAAVDTPVDDTTVTSALTAHDHAALHFQRVDAVNKLAQTSAAKADAIRDSYKYKEVIRNGTDAKAKLRSMAIQEKFVVPDEVARNMQSLVSYHNQKPEGKRYKTARVNGPTSMLMVWRTR